MIIYFTGTGNSRYLAIRLANQLNDTALDAAQYIKKREYPAFASEIPYIFVAPTYAWRLPRVFADWLRKCSFAGCRTAYYVLNCGSGIGAADAYIRPLSTELGLEHMGTARVLMPENYIAMFSAPDEDKAAAIIAKAGEQVQALARTVRAGQSFAPVKVNVIGRFCSGIVNSCFYRFSVSAKKFTATDSCIGCGRCAESCMLNNITLKDGKPSWGADCTHCMACICGCPKEAIEYGRHSKGLRRYLCPKESAGD